MNDAPRRFTHDEQVLGGQRGGAALRDRYARERAARDRAILKILQRAGGRKETSGCYGEYVALASPVGPASNQRNGVRAPSSMASTQSPSPITASREAVEPVRK